MTNLRKFLLTHGDDEDNFYLGEHMEEYGKLATRPFQDMQFSKYWFDHQYSDRGAVMEYVKSQMGAVHAKSPCGKCKGLLLITVPKDVNDPMEDDEEGQKKCHVPKDAIAALASEWLVAMTFHPLCDTGVIRNREKEIGL